MGPREEVAPPPWLVIVVVEVVVVVVVVVVTMAAAVDRAEALESWMAPLEVSLSVSRISSATDRRRVGPRGPPSALCCCWKRTLLGAVMRNGRVDWFDLTGVWR